ncbi:MAG: YolD-like family protein [Kurthia sp.]|nr:YolD-like family protein [Candidatus Kurthia equi]
MYKDRGTIKWTAMMLPEHVQKLRQWRNELDEKQPNALESWQLEELNAKIQLAFEQQKMISIYSYDEQWHEEKGRIERLDFQKKLVFLDDGLIMQKLPIHLIYRVIFHD